MSMTEPTQYLPFVNAARQSNHNATTMVECCCCPKTFRIADGFAYEAVCKEEHIIALWCSETCFLQSVPVTCCGVA